MLTGCYTLKSAYHQMVLLSSKESYNTTLNRPDLTEDQKRKLKLVQDVLTYAKNKLKLEANGNYSEVAWLNRSYVSWVVSAADKWSLKSHEWSFPIVGRVPYLGFFSEKEALEKEQELQKKNLDTYLRGVSAYSTLGWFEDPLLSSMLRYDDHDLVETLVHELVHTTFWVKNSAEFNERLASFLGQKGTLIYYKEIEGPDSPTTKLILDEAYDEKLFSDFITMEVKNLEAWYNELTDENKIETIKLNRLQAIQEKFQKELQPKLKSKRWLKFPEIKLNNARLTMYRTYVSDYTDFERIWKNSEENFLEFFKRIDSIKNSKNPDQDIKKIH